MGKRSKTLTKWLWCIAEQGGVGVGSDAVGWLPSLQVCKPCPQPSNINDISSWCYLAYVAYIFFNLHHCRVVEALRHH